MDKCTDCPRLLDPEDTIKALGSGRLSPQGSPRCGPCYHRLCFPTPETLAWITQSLTTAFTGLTTVQRGRLNAYLKKPGARLAVGPDLVRKYWVYEGVPRIEVVACGVVPRKRKVWTPRPAWVDLACKLERVTEKAETAPALSYAVAILDASLAHVKAALRRRPRKKVEYDPFEGLL
jgi:hypothetical protein